MTVVVPPVFLVSDCHCWEKKKRHSRIVPHVPHDKNHNCEHFIWPKKQKMFNEPIQRCYTILCRCCFFAGQYHRTRPQRHRYRVSNQQDTVIQPFVCNFCWTSNALFVQQWLYTLFSHKCVWTLLIATLFSFSCQHYSCLRKSIFLSLLSEYYKYGLPLLVFAIALLQTCCTEVWYFIRHSGKQCNMGADVLLQNKDLNGDSGKRLLLFCPARSLGSPMVLLW